MFCSCSPFSFVQVHADVFDEMTITIYHEKEQISVGQTLH